MQKFFKPDNLDDLVTFLKTFGKSEKIFVLGAGSNILITDNKFDGFVVKLGKNFSNISLLPNNILLREVLYPIKTYQILQWKIT